MLDLQKDQHLEEFETMETQYSTNVHHVVSMRAYLMLSSENYHHDLVYISLRLHPDFLYVLVW